MSTHSSSPFFQFEIDFIDSLRCIPMVVRYKLDTCGIKLKLDHWHQFSQRERQLCVDQPCSTPGEIQDYRTLLQNLVMRYTGALPKDLEIPTTFTWDNLQEIPQATQDQAQYLGLGLTLEQWQNLETIQRFVLIKLSRPSHENRNFLPALQEFGLTQ
jgi:hypothetical protein